MILELIVDAIAAVVAGIGGLFGEFTMPAWWSDLESALGVVGTAAAGFGDWVPVGTAVQAAMFVCSMLTLGLAIRLIRIVASFLTAGGGSAG